MNKKKDISGLIFSAFLIIAFVICSYYFINIIKASTQLDDKIKNLLTAAVFAVFGLILFYATRIGEGKQIKRFSLATLIILDLPALYILLASVAQGLPFPLNLNECTEVVLLAGTALGYGLPYTFLSGYEQDVPVSENIQTDPDNDEDNDDDEDISSKNKEIINDELSDAEDE